MKPPRFDEAQLARMRAARAAGVTFAEIGQRFGVHAKTIQLALSPDATAYNRRRVRECQALKREERAHGEAQ